MSSAQIWRRVTEWSSWWQVKQCIATLGKAMQMQRHCKEGQTSVGVVSVCTVQRATQGMIVLPKCLRLDHYNLQKDKQDQELLKVKASPFSRLVL